MSVDNWAGNHRYPAPPVRPKSHDELASLITDAVASGRSVGVVGARHSFSPVADGDLMVDLAALPQHFEVSPDRATMRVGGAMTYARLAELAAPEQVALANLASLPHVTVAGAVATGTHGSGSKHGSLATQVRALTVMGGDGEIRRIDDPELVAGFAVNLGAAGCCLELELAVEPSYRVDQRVFVALPWSALSDNFDSIMDCGYSVSVFTDWAGSTVEQVWVKSRTGDGDRSGLLRELGAADAAQPMHPIMSLPADGCTEQFGAPGPWSDRLPHFKADTMPNVGAEIQTEYFVARTDGVAAVQALRAIGAELAPNLLVSEIRSVAADRLWLSPFHDRHSVAFHFTWKPGQAAAERSAGLVARALAPFAPRPHWGKVFPAGFDVVAAYPMAQRFVDEVVDPAFVGPWLSTLLPVDG